MYEKRQNSAILYVLIGAVLIALILFAVPKVGKQRAVAGIRDPKQEAASGSEEISLNGFDLKFTYLYSYDIEALVVGTHNYHGSDVGDKLAPKDVALAWGKVAEYNTVIDFHWNQSNRWYFWKVNSYEELAPVGSTAAVSLQSANNHLIATDSAVRKAIGRIRVGDHIRMQGFLVNVDGRDASGRTFLWHSSTTRGDTGSGSCEVFYVKSVEWLD